MPNGTYGVKKDVTLEILNSVIDDPEDLYATFKC